MIKMQFLIDTNNLLLLLTLAHHILSLGFFVVVVLFRGGKREGVKEGLDEEKKGNPASNFDPRV